MAKLLSLPVEAPKVENLDDAWQVIAELGALNLELLARLGQNSRNSSRPPSSDGSGNGAGGGGGKTAGDVDTSAPGAAGPRPRRTVQH